jgi:outer membrane receptor protein involved in Fe transport
MGKGGGIFSQERNTESEIDMAASKLSRLVALIIVSLLLAEPARAQVRGKIAGTITDAQSGEVLIGANVVIEGTGTGAATDERGDYFILQLRPGTYDLVASYIGYHTRIVRDVQVRGDLTTRLDIELESELIESPEIEIVADRRMVQPDVTFTRRTTSRETMESLPGLDSASDVFNLQAGAIVSNLPSRLDLEGGQQLQVRDESVQNIHVRGGRGGEILFMVDGMPVTHPIYGGRSVLDLNIVDVEQIELLTGAFSAKYGQAQSGVVNISTRSGSEQLEGGITYKTDALEVVGESFKKHYMSTYISGREPITSDLLPRLGIDLPGEMFFFGSVSGDLTNTPYNNNRTRDSFSILGLDIPEHQENSGNVTLKLNYKMTDRIESIFSYHGSWKRWSGFEWLWSNHPDHMAEYGRDNTSMTLQFRHMLSPSTFYDVNFGFLGVDYRGSLQGRTPQDFWNLFDNDSNGTPDSAVTTIRAPQQDPLTGFYDAQGYESIWRNDDMQTYTVKADLISQVLAHHMIETGFEVKYNDIAYVDIQDGGVKLSPYGMYRFEDGTEVPPPPGPFKEFGQNRWVFFAKPLIGGAYLQNKYERASLIINVGARWDWFLSGPEISTPAYKEQWEAATGLGSDWNRFKSLVSPRFGISFPISLNTVIFFSYGHFNQLPELQFFYRDPYTGGFTGNPHLDYVQTILYEFGFTHQFTDHFAVDIKSYNKDISRQIGTTRLLSNLGRPVDLYDNNGYARARGIELNLTKRYSNYTSGDLSYTAQWATGYSSSAFEDYIRSTNDFPNPIRERRLDWDIRHQVVLQGMIAPPPGEPTNLFGLEFGNWSLTVLSRLASGYPYTPGTTDEYEAQQLENAETAPPTFSTDLKFEKGVRMGGIELSLLAEVFNVFDSKNTQVGYGFNPWTGEPFIYSDVIQNTNQIYNWYDMYRIMDPRRLSLGRHLQFGLQLNW